MKVKFFVDILQRVNLNNISRCRIGLEISSNPFEIILSQMYVLTLMEKSFNQNYLFLFGIRTILEDI